MFDLNSFIIYKFYIYEIYFIFVFYSNFLFFKEVNSSFVAFNDFIKTIDYIRKYYVNCVRYDELFLGVIKGLLLSLDVNFMFFNKDEFDELKLLSVSEFIGLGTKVSLIKGYPVIVGVIYDSFAYKCGLGSSDILVGIDNYILSGLILKQIVNLIRGSKNITVLIKLIRFNSNKLLTVCLTRDVIKLSSVKYCLLDENYGYIKIF